MRHFVSRGLAAVCALLSATAMAETAAAPFRQLPPISAPDGRWDFASWDDVHHRLLVAHGKDALVVDPAKPGDVRVVGALAGAHQALAIPGGDRLLVTSGHDNSVRIFDLNDNRQVANIAVADDPDAVILSTDGRRAYAMGAKVGAVSVIDLDTLKETARIAVKPGLEVPVWLDDHTLAINDEDFGEIELVDTASNKTIGAVAMPGCEGPTGLAYAASKHLALSACANGQAALVDMAARRLVKLIPIGQGPDTAIWDAAHSRFLVPCGKSGTLSVISLDPGGATAIATVATATSARTAAMDPATGRVYLPAASFQPAAAGQRPSMQAGSFRIVVLTPIE